MPTFNRAKLISRAIDSAINQTFEDFELIVINDGSTDNTHEILKSIDDRRVRVITQENAGVAAARNKGMAEAQGEFIAYLDSDNTWHADFLKIVADELKSPYVAVYTGQNLLLVGGTLEKPEVIGRKTRSISFNPVAFEKGNYIDIGSFVHRADILDKVGSFDTTQPWAEDWDLIGRIAIQYPFYIKHIDQILCDYYAYLPGILSTQTNQDVGWSDSIKAAFGVAPEAERDRKLAAHITEMARKHYPVDRD